MYRFPAVFRLCSNLFFFTWTENVDLNGEIPCEYDFLKLSIVCIPLQLVLMKSFTAEAVALRSHKTFAQFLLLFFLVLICRVIGNLSFLLVTSAHAYFIHFNPQKTPTLSIYEGIHH